MKKIVCDVCGKEIKKYAYKIGFKPVLMCKAPYTFEYDMRDICDECFYEMRRIIEGKRNESNACD